MKLSKYNILLKRKNGSLIYNSFTNNYVALPNTICNDLYAQKLDVFEQKHPVPYSILYKQGLIIQDEKDELAIIKYKNKLATFSSRELRIVVYPTQDCNLKCWYCYENHIPNTRLNTQVADNIVKYVKKNLEQNTFDDFYMTLFGGEPLIDFNTIAYPLCKEIKRIVEKHGKTFSCFFVTNGSLIQEETLEKFKLISLRFQITLDGNKERHDKVRIWKKGNQPTFEHIMWALHRLVTEINDTNFFITLRINYDNDTLFGAKDILERIKDIDRKKIFVHFERVWQTEGQVTESQKTLLKQTMLDFIKEGFCVDQGAFHGYPYSCPSDMNNSVVINHNGTIHKCNGRTLGNSTQYGVLKNDGTLDLNQDKVAKRMSLSIFENQECLNCKMLPACMGPCSQKLLEHNGKWAKEICLMGSIDTSLSDYLLMDFMVKSMIEKYND